MNIYIKFIQRTIKRFNELGTVDIDTDEKNLIVLKNLRKCERENIIQKEVVD